MSNLVNLETLTTSSQTFRVGETLYLNFGDVLKNDYRHVTVDAIEQDGDHLPWLVVSDCEDNVWDVDPESLSTFAR